MSPRITTDPFIIFNSVIKFNTSNLKNEWEIDYKKFIEYDPSLNEDNNVKKIYGGNPKKRCDYWIIRSMVYCGDLYNEMRLYSALVKNLLFRVSTSDFLYEGKQPDKYSVGQVITDYEDINDPDITKGITYQTRMICQIPVKCHFNESVPAEVKPHHDVNEKS